MNVKDQINKLMWNSFEVSKDTLVKNIISAVNSGALPLKKESLPTLVTLIQGSSDEAFNKCNSTISREILSVVESSTKSQAQPKTAKKN
jgi:hypothetical protein